MMTSCGGRVAVSVRVEDNKRTNGACKTIEAG